MRLGDWGLIRAQGADAASFLHGQLTNDIAHLGADEARLAGYCSAKGTYEIHEQNAKGTESPKDKMQRNVTTC